jgi:hypothetical protein
VVEVVLEVVLVLLVVAAKKGARTVRAVWLRGLPKREMAVAARWWRVEVEVEGKWEELRAQKV